jgi:glycosyltransferase involved in cell wall biosynthesis
MIASGTADPIGRSPKRRVLMLLGNNPYPRDQRVRAEAAALTQAGYAVSVICPGRGGEASRETIDGVAVYRYRERVGNASGVIGYAVEFLYATIAALGLSFRIRGGFDVIHAHNPPDTFVLVALVHRLRGKRFVFDHHDLAPDLYQALTGGKGNGLVLRVLAFFERRSLRAADRVIATNDSYKQVAIERGGVPSEKITVVRNGPDLDRIRPTAPDEELRSKAGTILAYAGEIGRHDGLDYLLRALDHLVS